MVAMMVVGMTTAETTAIIAVKTMVERANLDGNLDRRDGNNDLRHYLGGHDLRDRIN